MSVADYIGVAQLIVLVLQAVMLPAVYRLARFLWRLERRVYTIELELGIAERKA